MLAAVLATLAATLPTFVSLSAAGAGATRCNGGPVGKTERCALAVLATAVPAWLAGICLVVVAGSLLTAAWRLRAAHAELLEGSPAAGGDGASDRRPRGGGTPCCTATAAGSPWTSTSVRCTCTPGPRRLPLLGHADHPGPGRDRGARLGQAELRRRWLTWALIAPGGRDPDLDRTGPDGGAGGAARCSACVEYAPLVRLPSAERAILFGLAVAFPLAAWLRPSWLALAPLLALLVRGPRRPGRRHRARGAPGGAHRVRVDLALLVAGPPGGAVGATPSWSASPRQPPTSPRGAAGPGCGGSAGPAVRSPR